MLLRLLFSFFDDTSLPSRYGSVEHMMPDGRFVDSSSIDINFSLDVPANHAITDQPSKQNTAKFNDKEASIFRIQDTRRFEVGRQDVELLDCLGHGWFGSVMEARVRRTKSTLLTFENAIALCLKDDASKEELTRFQEEIRASKLAVIANHECVLGLIAECTPHMALLEVCAMADLKHFLASRRDQLQVLLDEGLLLKFCVQITRGVAALHAMDAVPTDLALRTCQLTANLDVKVGDYGLAATRYLDDYVPVGGEPFPVRWMPPEILGVLDTLGEDEELIFTWSPTHGIWALAITLWEVASGARRPFDGIADAGFVHFALASPHQLRDTIGQFELRGTDLEAIASVIDLCLKVDPRSRPVCSRLERYLNDFYEVTLEDLQNRTRFGSQTSSGITDDSVFERAIF